MTEIKYYLSWIYLIDLFLLFFKYSCDFLKLLDKRITILQKKIVASIKVFQF